PRDSLEGTNRSERDKVQSSNDSPHLGGNTSERAEGSSTASVSTAVPKASTVVAVEVDTAKSDVDAARQEVNSSRLARSVLTLKPLPSIDPKDKGKGILVEEEPVKIKRKDQVIYQIERDEELAHKLHEEELAEIRKFRAAQRAAEIRSRPPTKTQLRNLMMTYLKNMGGYKHSQLKAKTFEEIQAMYKRQKKIIDDFNLMDSINAVKDSKKEAGEDTSK
ncbi:hypothetical protein Tco_0786828, partial [Tanacetum coccineum]